MSTLRIGDKVRVTWSGDKKEAEVVDMNGQAVELKIEGEPGTIFMELISIDRGRFKLKSGSCPVRCEKL